MMQVPSVSHGSTLTNSKVDEVFTPARALEAVGDKWSLLIIRDALFRGTTRSTDFERNSGVAPGIVADRLDGFIRAGLMTLEHDPDEPGQQVYTLTSMGRNLEPVVIALTTWGDGWTQPQGPPIAIAQGSRIAKRLVSAHLGSTDAPPEPLFIEISLLGSFSVRIGGEVVEDLSVGSQRLLVFLALHDRTVARIAMAGAMWPDVSEEHASISLRSALSRLDTPSREAILSASAGLSLIDTVAVDLRKGQALARRLLQPGATPTEADVGSDAVATLATELLPDWYDDWVVAEAEDWRQLRVDALEVLAGFLTAAGRAPEAISAARAAVKVDPLRESGQVCLIKAYLAEGNQSEALRVFNDYRELLHNALGLTPTSHIIDLVTAIRKP